MFVKTDNAKDLDIFNKNRAVARAIENLMVHAPEVFTKIHLMEKQLEEQDIYVEEIKEQNEFLKSNNVKLTDDNSLLRKDADIVKQLEKMQKRISDLENTLMTTKIHKMNQDPKEKTSKTKKSSKTS